MLCRKKIEYSYIDNSILLKTETIWKNGFKEIWRQVNDKTYDIQILCYNPETSELQAFDRFHWMDEPYYDDGKGCFSSGRGYYYKEDLWTPINLHYTEKWLKNILKKYDR